MSRKVSIDGKNSDRLFNIVAGNQANKITLLVEAVNEICCHGEGVITRWHGLDRGFLGAVYHQKLLIKAINSTTLPFETLKALVYLIYSAIDQLDFRFIVHYARLRGGPEIHADWKSGKFSEINAIKLGSDLRLPHPPNTSKFDQAFKVLKKKVKQKFSLKVGSVDELLASPDDAGQDLSEQEVRTQVNWAYGVIFSHRLFEATENGNSLWDFLVTKNSDTNYAILCWLRDTKLAKHFRLTGARGHGREQDNVTDCSALFTAYMLKFERFYPFVDDSWRRRLVDNEAEYKHRHPWLYAPPEQIEVEKIDDNNWRVYRQVNGHPQLLYPIDCSSTASPLNGRQYIGKITTNRGDKQDISMFQARIAYASRLDKVHLQATKGMCSKLFLLSFAVQLISAILSIAGEVEDSKYLSYAAFGAFLLGTLIAGVKLHTHRKTLKHFERLHFPLDTKRSKLRQLCTRSGYPHRKRYVHRTAIFCVVAALCTGLHTTMTFIPEVEGTLLKVSITTVAPLILATAFELYTNYIDAVIKSFDASFYMLKLQSTNSTPSEIKIDIDGSAGVGRNNDQAGAGGKETKSTSPQAQ